MDVRTRFGGHEVAAMEEAINAIIDSRLAAVHTHVPFRVVSVDYSKKPPTLVAQPTIKATVAQPDGSQKWVDLPQVPDVPIHFPGGGGVSMTFPIKAGDEGLLMISTRSIDQQQQSGGDQQQLDLRPHDLSNAYAMVGTRTQATALDSVAGASTQIRSDDGKHVVDINPSSGLSLSSSEAVNLAVGGQSMSFSKDGISVTGTVNVTGDIVLNGVSLKNHVHGGVQTGGSDTSTPH